MAERAFASIGPYVVGRQRKRKHKPVDVEILRTIEKLKDNIQEDAQSEKSLLKSYEPDDSRTEVG